MCKVQCTLHHLSVSFCKLLLFFSLLSEIVSKELLIFARDLLLPGVNPICFLQSPFKSKHKIKTGKQICLFVINMNNKENICLQMFGV